MTVLNVGHLFVLQKYAARRAFSMLRLLQDVDRTDRLSHLFNAEITVNIYG